MQAETGAIKFYIESLQFSYNVRCILPVYRGTWPSYFELGKHNNHSMIEVS